MLNPTDRDYRGKLLLTGEYVVLDGVPALAVPTKPGQRLRARKTKGDSLNWRAIDERGNAWFTSHLHWDGSMGYNRSPNATSRRLYDILRAADDLRPGVLVAATTGWQVTTELDFNRSWGLGTSSTMIAGVADWLGVNPYALLEHTFGGSGYDIACATSGGPIVYERAGTTPRVQEIEWRPDWLKQTWFVYRNEKQNSRDGIRAYRGRNITDRTRRRIGEITRQLTPPDPSTGHLREAQTLLREHETIMSEALGRPTVQEELFGDFAGVVKSLGAWGGDFVWALSDRPMEEVKAYFNDRGYDLVIPYDRLIL